MVVQDCRQTNPVMLVFCQLMFDTINARRAMADRPRHVDEDYVTYVCACVWPKGRGVGGGGNVPFECEVCE